MTSENMETFSDKPTVYHVSPNFDFREFQLRVTSTLSNKYKYLRPPGFGDKHTGERTQTTTGQLDSQLNPSHQKSSLKVKSKLSK